MTVLHSVCWQIVDMRSCLRLYSDEFEPMALV